MPPSLGSDLGFGSRCGLKIFKMAWIAKRNDLNNFESLCRSNASHQVSAQSNLRHGAILDIRTELFLQFWISIMLQCLPSFRLNLTYGLGRDVVWRISERLSWLSERNDFSNSESLSMWCFPSSFSSIQLKAWEEMSFEEFQDGHYGSHLGYQNGTILAILKLCNTPMPPIRFRLNLTYGLGGDVVWRISRWWPS